MSATTATARRFHVYVVELDPSVLDRKRFRRANPHRDPRKPCLYVGQSAHDPETRLAQHRRGYKSSPLVRDFAVRLVTELCTALPAGATREDAKAEEARLAEELRKRGHGVWYN